MNQEIATVGGAMSLALVRPIATPSDLISLHKEVSKLITESLESGVDYGVVPGTGSKPSLLKPGAERLALAFGAHPQYSLVSSEVDHDRAITYTKRKKRWLNRTRTDKEWVWDEVPGESRGIYRYIYECRLVRHDGRLLGTGQGVCSTMESKYVDRPRDCENTALKMAQKRAFVAATLNAFGLSNRFTQDVEDMDNHEPAAATPASNDLVSEAPAELPAPQKRQAKVYERDPAQVTLLHGLLAKRDVPPEIWGHIDAELLGKPFTALATIVPAERAKFEAHIESLVVATPVEPA